MFSVKELGKCMNKLVKGIGKLGISMIVALISGIGVLWATESMKNSSESLKTPENNGDYGIRREPK